MNYLENAKKQLDNLTKQSSRTTMLQPKDVVMMNALIAIAEQLEKLNNTRLTTFQVWDRDDNEYKQE